MTRTIFDNARAYLLKHPDVDGDQVSEPLRWVSHGEYIFKGLAEPHEIFEVFVEGVVPGSHPRTVKRRSRCRAADDLSWRPKPGEPIPYRTPTWTLREVGCRGLRRGLVGRAQERRRTYSSFALIPSTWSRCVARLTCSIA